MRLQPIIGYCTDKHPQPWSLPIGMGFTLAGLSLLALASNFPTILLAAMIIAPYGRGYVAWFTLAALLAIVVLLQISHWYQS